MTKSEWANFRRQSFKWKLTCLRLMIRDKLGFDPNGTGSIRLYRMLIILDR